MNTNRLRRTALAVAAVAVLPLSMTACSGDSGSSADSKPSASAKDDSKPTDQSSKKAEAMDGPFGSACSAVPKTGDGSFEGMAKDPVAT
ncbi:MAG TPA: fasciclin domain-containing protein, partial [Streptomyces sp.]|nr:fasciclin domain-containing protein [Streptomyces sp.]